MTDCVDIVSGKCAFSTIVYDSLHIINPNELQRYKLCLRGCVRFATGFPNTGIRAYFLRCCSTLFCTHHIRVKFIKMLCIMQCSHYMPHGTRAHMYTRTHARTHARTHTRTHVRNPPPPPQTLSSCRRCHVAVSYSVSDDNKSLSTLLSQLTSTS